MGKIKRGGYLFYFWIGDHSPRHCHVYNDNGFVLIYNLENMKILSGKPNRKVERIIQDLIKEGLL